MLAKQLGKKMSGFSENYQSRTLSSGSLKPEAVGKAEIRAHGPVKSVVIASHVFAFGTSQALKQYFERKKVPVMFVGHALFGNILTWSWGAIDTFFILTKEVARKRRSFDLFVGSNNLNAFVGVICRKLRLVQKVVYFSPDYSHTRFQNRVLNYLYHWMDYYCIRNADWVWNSSSIMPVDPMMRERERRGIPQKYRSKQIQVPDGTDPKEVLPLEKVDRYLVGFVGHLREGMGVELLISSFPEIRKRLPRAKLLIIGSGPIEARLRELSKGIDGIEMTGYMGDINEVYRRLSHCAIAVAPYEAGSISQYTDPGKVKVYLSVGLPMVISKVPQVASEIDCERCGIAVEPGNKPQLVEAITKLLSDELLLRDYRGNAIRLKEKYAWDNIFDRALSVLS